MKLENYLDVSKLNEHIQNRVVNVQAHPYLPLRIYNYGQKAQFEDIWDDITVKTRGLIVDKQTNEIISRPFQKFFNLGHSGRPETWLENLEPRGLPTITEKLDGSLGVYYRHNGVSGIATRGSFASDQAAWASTWYKKNLSQAKWPEGWTPLFEIIYPDNRIVVKYDWEGLRLLALVNNENGEELPYIGLAEIAYQNNCPYVNKCDVRLEEAPNQTKDNFEGYVATWLNPGAPPFRVKIKLLEYCKLHRLITGISPKEIWRRLKDGEPFEDLLHTPDHYQQWVNYWRNGLQAEYGRVEQRALSVWANCPYSKDGQDKEARKQIADFFTSGDRKPLSAVLFSLLDGKDYSETIWRMVRDRTKDEEPFRKDGE